MGCQQFEKSFFEISFEISAMDVYAIGFSDRQYWSSAALFPFGWELRPALAPCGSGAKVRFIFSTSARVTRLRTKFAGRLDTGHCFLRSRRARLTGFSCLEAAKSSRWVSSLGVNTGMRTISPSAPTQLVGISCALLGSKKSYSGRSPKGAASEAPCPRMRGGVRVASTLSALHRRGEGFRRVIEAWLLQPHSIAKKSAGATLEGGGLSGLWAWLPAIRWRCAR